MSGQDGASRDSKPADLVNLAHHFAHTERFQELFTYGMDLVEETAGFLDGEGRREAKFLGTAAQALYGTESMRLTTRLMQLASWLLLQRAVVEGEMTPEQALSEKKNVKLNQQPTRKDNEAWSQLPASFHDLVDRSLKLQNRVARLDAEIYCDKPAEAEATNGVAAQLSLLETAFDPRFRSRR